MAWSHFFLTCGARKSLKTVSQGRRAVLLLFLPSVWMEWLSLQPLPTFSSSSRPPLGPSCRPPPRSPGRAGCLHSRPVTCRGSCMETLALLLSGRCCFLWQITEIPLGTPALPLFPALQNRAPGAWSEVGPAGALAGRGRLLPVTPLPGWKGEGHLALWKERG